MENRTRRHNVYTTGVPEEIKTEPIFTTIIQENFPEVKKT